MATLASLLIGLGIDAKEYHKGLDEATSKTQGLAGTLKNVLGGIGTFALGAAAAGTAALGTSLSLVVNEAMNAELVLAQLDAVLTSTNGAAGVTREMALGIADSLSTMTRYEDDAILAGENLLLTFTNIGKDIFPEATQTMLDMSTALGIDLESAATMLGKSLQDPILGVTALRRVGVNFSDDQMKLIKTLVETGNALEAKRMILAELQTEFGGSARAAGETFAGQLDILKNTLSNVGEEIGMALLPSIKDLAGELLTFVQSDQFQEWVKTVTNWIQNELPRAIQTAQEFWNNDLKPMIDETWLFIRNDLLPAFQEIVKILGVILPPIVSAFTKGWELLAKAFDFALTTIRNMITSLENLKDILGKIKLPDWLTPGSPTPLELGILGINKALGLINRQGLPEFSAKINGGGLAGAPALAGITPVNVSNSNPGQPIIFNYQPFISTMDHHEAERVLKPFIVSVMRGEEARKR